MTSINTLVQRVSEYLADQEEDFEYETWTEEQLQWYARMAMGMISLADKKRYTKRVEVPLVAGSEQQVPDTCKELVRVQGVKVNGEMVYTRRVNQAMQDLARTLKAPKCPTNRRDATATPRTYSIASDDNTIVQVTPPVPEGSEGVLVLSCYNPADAVAVDAELDLVPGGEVAVVEFMLYYAFGVEIESVGMRQESEKHWRNGITVLANLNLDAAAVTAAKQRAA